MHCRYPALLSALGESLLNTGRPLLCLPSFARENMKRRDGCRQHLQHRNPQSAGNDPRR